MNFQPFLQHWLRPALATAVAAVLVACSTPPAEEERAPDQVMPVSALPRLETHPVGPSIQQAGSLWTPVPWSDLPGFAQDPLNDAWASWLQSCQRPHASWMRSCVQVRALAHASDDQRRAWMQQALQPYLVRSHEGNPVGMLTSYYEPVMEASRTPGNGYHVPLYQLPRGFGGTGAWYTRQQIETLPQAQAQLQGREIAWLKDPVDAMILHIQGSGRLNLQLADGRPQQVRVAFAGTNNQPYQSIGRWLLQRKLITDASWPGIKAWVNANPGQVQEMLWSNPRYVFFKEEALPPQDQQAGPRGAQGVPLTAGRSIAVDKRSIPYGTPVWLMTAGATLNEKRLVLAQDTGSAIVGAVRADFYAGSGQAAGDLAGRVKQDLYMWTLWPKGAPMP